MYLLQRSVTTCLHKLCRSHLGISRIQHIGVVDGDNKPVVLSSGMMLVPSLMKFHQLTIEQTNKRTNTAMPIFIINKKLGRDVQFTTYNGK
jgi:hypothetical protein